MSEWVSERGSEWGNVGVFKCIVAIYRNIYL